MNQLTPQEIERWYPGLQYAIRCLMNRSSQIRIVFVEGNHCVVVGHPTTKRFVSHSSGRSNWRTIKHSTLRIECGRDYAMNLYRQMLNPPKGWRLKIVNGALNLSAQRMFGGARMWHRITVPVSALLMKGWRRHVIRIMAEKFPTR